MKNRLLSLALALTLCLGLIAPAQAYTMNTLVATKDYFVFEGGIIDAKWTKVISHITEDGATVINGRVYYRPTVYIPLGSKITLTQNALDQGYRMAIAQDNIAIEVALTSCAFNYINEMVVIIYKLENVNHDGSFSGDFEICAIGVKDAVAADLLTPFTDISYFDERMEVTGSYNKTVNTILSEELRGDIDWVYSQGLIPGTSATTFSPYKTITKAELAQALWIYSGKPEPQNLAQNPFADMATTDPYYKAAVWAYENGLLKKYGTSDFKPNSAASKNQIKLALEQLFNCSLPETIYDGEEHVTGVGGFCSRANAAHLIHYAHTYVKGDTPSTPNNPNTPDTPTTPDVPTFSDVKAGAYYADAVKWAIDKDITTGTSGNKFSPGEKCTHIQILTFLYRAAEQIKNPSGEDMEKAVTWAQEKGMLAADFNRTKPCTRAEAVSYIWHALGRHSAPASSFTDVPAGASYAQAVDWAVANGVTTGTDTVKNTFSPNDTCTRGQIVTFLHRAMG